MNGAWVGFQPPVLLLTSCFSPSLISVVCSCLSHSGPGRSAGVRILPLLSGTQDHSLCGSDGSSHLSPVSPGPLGNGVQLELSLWLYSALVPATGTGQRSAGWCEKGAGLLLLRTRGPQASASEQTPPARGRALLSPAFGGPCGSLVSSPQGYKAGEQYFP